MNTPIFPLILDEQEIFLLYKSIVTARQYKEIEFEETRNNWHTHSPAFSEMQLLEEIAQAAITIIAGSLRFCTSWIMANKLQ